MLGRDGLRELIELFKDTINAHKRDAQVHLQDGDRANINAAANKVDKEEGKGLSSNDFTDDLRDKLVQMPESGVPGPQGEPGESAAAGLLLQIVASDSLTAGENENITSSITLPVVANFKPLAVAGMEAPVATASFSKMWIESGVLNFSVRAAAAFDDETANFQILYIKEEV